QTSRRRLWSCNYTARRRFKFRWRRGTSAPCTYRPDAPMPLPIIDSALPMIDPEGYNLSVAAVSPTIRVKVLFFGRLKEIVGQPEDCADMAQGAQIETLFNHYRARYPQLTEYRASLVASRNQEFAAWNTPLSSGDEVAFLPPVSG